MDGIYRSQNTHIKIELKKEHQKTNDPFTIKIY
jgi:hypothetical protein